MECVAVTERTKSRGKPKIRAGMPIANIITSLVPQAEQEAKASNATLFLNISNITTRCSGSVKALMSIVSTVGLNQGDEPLFGQASLVENRPEFSLPVRLQSFSKIRINNQAQFVFNFSAASDNETNYSTAFDKPINNGKIYAFAKSGTLSVKSKASLKFNFKDVEADKLSGHTNLINSFQDFHATQKLYPIADIETSKNSVYFVNKHLAPTGLFASVDEGLFTGNYTKDRKSSSLISDEHLSYIQPSSIYSDGDFRYKCEITAPLIKPIENFLFIRAAAPMSVLESEIPPRYKIHNIRFEDPSGNLIAKYKDISIRGDSDFEKSTIENNFVTYVSEPLYNNAKKYNWDETIPLLNEASGYTLSMDFSATCFYRPFSRHFTKAYEDGCSLDFIETGDNDYLALDGSPLSTQTQGFEFIPNYSLRISNIEIAASGSVFGPLSENYTNLYTEVVDKGLRAERSIYPAQVLSSTFSSNIHPESETVWKTYDINSNTYYNDNPSHQAQFSNILNDLTRSRFVEIHQINGIPDSGKLHLKYEHKPPRKIKEKVGGPWGVGQKNPSSRLKSAKIEYVYGPDVFFSVDTIELHVRARKAAGTRDYALDVVGYSDDRVLMVTPSIGGFIQNKEDGVGIVPPSSGFNNPDDLTLSAESISSKEGYFYDENPIGDGGDHYVLTQTPLVNSTEFEDYVIPLQIKKTIPELGPHIDYRDSSYFEALYLDIYPLPSGAAISKADLVVTYKPSNAITLHTLGRGAEETSARYAALFTDDSEGFNAKIGTKPLSLIENIPHGYTSPDTLKTNYSKRWRGVDGGAKAGPFNAVQFDFSFSNPALEKPFVYGYYDFNNLDGNSVLSSLENNTIHATGIYNSSLQDNLINSIGMRFKAGSYTNTPYQSIDWTSQGDPLYGKIMDSFDNAVMVNGASKNINFGQVETSGGFSFFTRFSPGPSVTFNDEVLLSKWDAGKQLETLLCYKNGHLTAQARDENGNIIQIQDTIPYSGYQYPLPVLLTYNDNGSQQLKLYTDNEISSGDWSLLRATSNPFTITSGNSDLIIGHSYGSGVGCDGYITEVGLSKANIVSSDIDFAQQHIDVERFFDSFRSDFLHSHESKDANRYRMSNFVDEDTTKWHIGAFKYCEFGPGLDALKTRIGQDYITHEFYTDGFTYQNDCDLILPSSQIVLEDLAYHTQLENDMLRFSLSDVNDRFVAAAPRVVKTFPRGYDLAKDSIAVDTVIEYENESNIEWPNGDIGPRLIVSLYTTARDSDLFDTTNWGLINRDIHYLDPKLCWEKVQSTFNISSITDRETEPWSVFQRRELVNEQNHYRYSNDINNMFLQYDLAYPSGSYSSKINIHSCHVRLEDALHLSDVLYIDDFNLAISGESVVRDYLNLYSSEPVFNTSSEVNFPSGLALYASGSTIGFTSSQDGEVYGLPLFSSGAFFIDTLNDPLNIFTYNSTGIVDELNMFTIGIISHASSQGNFGSFDYSDNTSSKDLFGASTGNGFSEDVFYLSTKNTDVFNGPASSGTLNLFTNLGSFIYDDDVNLSVTGKYRQTIVTGGRRVPSAKSSLNFVIRVEEPDNIASASSTLYVDGYDPNIVSATGNLPLHTLNINPVNSSLSWMESFLWNGKDLVGRNITIEDDSLLSLRANDEIRGVITTCYGDCDSNGNCYEYQLYTHDTLWFDTQCIDGGVIRPITIYNNPDTIGFNVLTDGYDRHFYGTRKLDNLIPGAPYTITVTAQTGSSGVLDVPREISEIEYGTNNEVNYSGVKIVAEDVLRNAFDHYGYSVDVCDDLMAIGVPYYSLEENGKVLDKSGSVFLYKRNPAPSGYDWSNQPDKSSWAFDSQLTLPNGWLRDYYIDTDKKIVSDNRLLKDTTITERQYYVGQWGRELGHSLSIAKTPDRQIVVTGGPGGKWSREFEDPNPKPVSIAIFIFTDEFQPSYTIRRPRKIISWRDILPYIEGKDTLFKYFCDPPVSFDIKIIICEGVIGTDIEPSLDFSQDPNLVPEPDFVFKRKISRVQGFTTLEQKRAQDNVIFEELKDIFNEFFPVDSNKINNGMPVIAGFYVDDSVSYGTAALGSPNPKAIESGGLKLFIDWFKQYTFDNGLVDTDSLPAYPFIQTVIRNDETWVSQAISCIDTTLSIEDLIETKSFLLFANNLGSFNENLNEFNLPPPSGGSVYIFENINDSWEVIQEIQSPTTDNTSYIDRFGHDVAISEDASTIVVGSPYINEAVQIYHYNKYYQNNFDTFFIEWLRANGDPTVDVNFGELYRARNVLNSRLSEVFSINGRKDAARSVFEELSPSGKFAYRKSYPYDPYVLVRTINQAEVQASHTWPWLFSEYAPTSRLGYSVDVNEDGTSIVMGCPTDSFGAQDEGILWYKPGYQRSSVYNWASNVNAGAVRVLEGRNYYPHKKVVQYGVFGNYHRALSDSDPDGVFDHFGPIFEVANAEYLETEFVDPEIPEDAGTLMIITPDPRVNALSEEIIQNIKQWLALGDRNLVLVGNDPIWEESGAYADSNSLINTLLERLDSRMRLHPARTRYESMVDVDTGLYYNNIESFLPEKTTSSYVARSVSMRGSGVADIRLHDPNISKSYSCTKPATTILTGLETELEIAMASAGGNVEKMTYPELHYLCNMPIKDGGDLRSEWIDQCLNDRGGYVSYKVNIAFVYGTHTICDWLCACDPPPDPLPTISYEPIPILAAAEKVEFITQIPGIPETEETIKVFDRFVTSVTRREYKSVAETGIAFLWSADSGNYTYLNMNESKTVSDSLFFDPLEFNNKNALLQAKAGSFFETEDKNTILRNNFPVCVSQNFGATSSVVLTSFVFAESTTILNFGNDENIKFYMNLTDKNSTGGATIGQLGGWTNRESFASGYSESRIGSFLQRLGNSVVENVDPETINIPGNFYDILWIANTDAIATDAQVNELVKWLNQGNKKLIITFGNSFSTGDREAAVLSKIRAAENLVNKLGLDMKPYFISSKNKYADHRDVRDSRNLNSFEIPNSSYLKNGKRGSSSTLSVVSGPWDYSFLTAIDPSNSTVLAYASSPIIGIETIEKGVSFMRSGFAKVSFEVEEATSYRVFFTTASESINETRPLGFKIAGAYVGSIQYEPPLNNKTATLYAKDENFVDYAFAVDYPFMNVTLANRTMRRDIPETWPITNYTGSPDTYYKDITVPKGQTEISIYIDSEYIRAGVNSPEDIMTQRLISISGAKVGIDTTVKTRPIFKEEVVTVPAVPPTETSRLVTRQISTGSSKYCPTTFCENLWGVPGPAIADGPVTVAQELYHQAPFRNGYNRSRITLISDPSLIQGATILEEEDKTLINTAVAIFLRSLYPTTFQENDVDIWEDFDFNPTGKQYLYLTKLVSPEKSSPAKLLVDSANPGFNNLFGQYNITTKPASRFSNLDNVVDVNTQQWMSPGEPFFHKASEFVEPRPIPPGVTDENEAIRLARLAEKEKFQSLVEAIGVHSKFRTTINGTLYEDPYAGIPKLMQDYGYDYLNFQQMSHVISGYPGDLFGYKVKIYKDKIYVSSPFSIFTGEEITDWETVKQQTPNGPIYNADIGYYGGAGSVYVYEKNFKGVGVNNSVTDWSCTRKIRPDTLSTDGDGDKFGQSFDVDGDVLAISSPGHSSDALIVRTSGDFIRKEFNAQFAIAGVDKYDLGDKSLPNNILSSGIEKNSAGALFVYENKISDWGSKSQDWTFVQKVIPQGYNSRNSNENFGTSVAVDRYSRSDSDYAIVAGSPLHGYGLSGDAAFLASGGAVFTYDAMLRRLAPSFANPESNIAGRIFGDVYAVSEEDKYMTFNFKNGFKYNELKTTDGVVFADQNGEIFLEVSGQDKNDRGYAVHRPFIQNIKGSYLHGKYIPEYSRLFVAGKPPDTQSALNLFSPDVADNVYNTLGMYSFGILDSVSGVKPLNISISGGLIDSVNNSGDPLFLIMASGSDILTQQMDLYTRGKIV